MTNRFATACLMLASIALAAPAWAEYERPSVWPEHAIGEGPTGQWTLVTSNLVTHHRSDPEHNNRPGLLGLEYSRADSDWLAGGVTFRNSFSQRSQYAYVGRRFDSGRFPVYAKLTGGVLQGYRGEHRDKIPLNRLGVAPAIVPAVGVQMNRVSSELVVLGASALALTVNYDF
ncbi:sn-glycerol-3-phosphate transporter [Alkalisalibacterium limincola]|nr:sn-glycerol-3-phosphate transporter [Alkalisalibacterium limincola]